MNRLRDEGLSIKKDAFSRRKMPTYKKTVKEVTDNNPTVGFFGGLMALLTFGLVLGAIILGDIVIWTEIFERL